MASGTSWLPGRRRESWLRALCVTAGSIGGLPLRLLVHLPRCLLGLLLRMRLCLGFGRCLGFGLCLGFGHGHGEGDQDLGQAFNSVIVLVA